MYYETLIDTLIKIAEFRRSHLNPKPTSKEEERELGIEHGVCDLLEDAAAAIDDLLTKLKGEKNEERAFAEAC